MNVDADTRHSDETDEYSNLSVGSNSDDPEACIRVGRKYQATIPALLPSQTRTSLVHQATLLWIPCKSMTNDSLDAYLRRAREQHRYSEEQALGMLLWHRHNLERALGDLGNFTQRPDDWLVEEQAIFRQGLVLYSKRFGEIQQQLLRERQVRDLIEYYYTKYKLDRAHKLQLNQQKLFGTRTKRQQFVSRRPNAAPNGHAGSTNWQSSQNGNGSSGRNAREPLSPQVRNLLSFLSPTQTHGSSANDERVDASKRSSNDPPSASFSYYHFVPQARRVNKPRGLQLEMSELREVISHRVTATHSELDALQVEYDEASQRLDDLRRTEQKPGPAKAGRQAANALTDRFDESRKQMLARCNRDVHQVRDRMHFNDSVGLFGGRRTTQRWSQNELVLLQTLLNRSVSEHGFTATFRVEQSDAGDTTDQETGHCKTDARHNQNQQHAGRASDNDVVSATAAAQDQATVTVKQVKDEPLSAVKTESIVGATTDQPENGVKSVVECKDDSAPMNSTNSAGDCVNGESTPDSRIGNQDGCADKESLANGEKAIAKRQCKYVPCDTVISQLLDVLTSKNTAMIEAFIVEKMRADAAGSLRAAILASNADVVSGGISGSPIVNISDDPSEDEVNLKQPGSNESGSLKRPFDRVADDDDDSNSSDVVLVEVTSAKKVKRE